MVAARIKQMQSFMGVMQMVVMPMFFISGALFPVANLPGWLAVLNRIDPLTYAVDPMRRLVFAHLDMSDAAREENYTDFELSDVSVQANAGASGVLVQGLIKNTGAKPASRSRLVFVGRDAAGDVVAAWAANGPAALGAGASDTFAFPVLDVAVAPATYQVLVRATA